MPTFITTAAPQSALACDHVLVEHLLDLVLQVAVDGQLQRGARPGRIGLVVAARQLGHQVADADLEGVLAIDAGEHLVVGGLKSAEAVHVGPGESDQVGRQLAARVIALLVRSGLDARQVQRPDLLLGSLS